MMGTDRKTALFNILTVVVLVALVCLVCFYGLVASNVLNPFPARELATRAAWPDTPTPGGPTPVPTWTPTNTPTITPTPLPSKTATRTLTPSVTPTFPPTRTPTPRVTRSPWSFTHEMRLGFPQYGCSWTGVAGQVEDLDGNPLTGYPVHVWGAGIDVVVTSGTDARFNTIYGHQAAWEQFFDSTPKSMEIRVQLHDPYRSDHPPISEEVVISLPGYCGGALGYVTFTQNH